MRNILIIFFCLLIFTSDALAHPPASMKIRYDKSSNQLTVIMNHRTSKGGNSKKRKHFIEEVAFTKNGENIDTRTFNFQINPSIVKVDFSMPQYEEKDTFTIEATCSTGAKSSKTFSASDLKYYQQAEPATSYQ